MKTNIYLALFTGSLLLAQDNYAKEKTPKADSFKENINLNDKSYSSTGRNKYFILEPGYQLVLEGKEDGKKTELIITVLDETKKIGDVETRVIEERESQDGKLVEVSRNYFAIGNDTHNVYYFGEDVDVYKGDKVTHEGSWRADTDNFHQGVMIPGEVKVGDKYYQEKAPKVAMDRGEDLSVSETLKTPAGAFKNCLKVKETTPIESGTEYKVYAPDIGLAGEGDLKLVKYGSIKK